MYSLTNGGFVEFKPSTNNINDPLFVDSGSRDFNLQSTSPCIDAGDIQIRHNGTIADIGALLFTSRT